MEHVNPWENTECLIKNSKNTKYLRETFVHQKKFFRPPEVNKEYTFRVLKVKNIFNFSHNILQSEGITLSHANIHVPVMITVMHFKSSGFIH